jgi:hypothetical protein
MYLHADDCLETLLGSDHAPRAEWTEFCKLRNDPRIIPVVGEFLRATSLDEPPLYGSFAEDYLSVKPRLTGPW